MATVYIDNQPYEVDAGKNMLDAALSLGFDLPYFCWHPCLDSVGACRQCAVKQFKDDEDQQGTIVMACMTPATDGTRIAIADDTARDFRARVVEWLMINHPHDCPVCEEGGECHLQDMTLMTGHTRRRYRGRKRTHRNQDLGPFISHEMNRCIACYRCTRYYRDYAGGDDLNAFGAHDHVYFGRQADGPLENPFSGNLVEVCPTGVFTDKTLGAHYTRKWDLQAAPSICHHCALGCNISPGARQGVLKRVQNRYHGEINHYFLCDRGRFGAGFVNRDDRPREPLHRGESAEPERLSMEQALETARGYLRDANGVVGIGSPSTSVEGNYALRRLVGAEHFADGMGTAAHALHRQIVDILQTTSARVPSLREVEDCDAVLVLGEDPTDTAPRLALALRQSVRNAELDNADQMAVPRWNDRAVRDLGRNLASPLYLATFAGTQLDDAATDGFRGDPAALVRLANAVAQRLDATAPGNEAPTAAEAEAAEAIAHALSQAKRPLVIAGAASGEPAILSAAANIAAALGNRAAITLLPAECNSVGVSTLGGHDVETVLQHVIDGRADTLVTLENDLFHRAPREQVERALAAARRVIAIDHSRHATTERADLVLPAGTFTEADGTLVNNEVRAQRFFKVYAPDAPIREAWRWCHDLLPEPPGWSSLDTVIAAIAEAYPALAGIRDAAPGADFRLAGMRVPRAPHRYSGRTALTAHESVHERTPPQDADAPLSHTMEGWPGQRPGALQGFSWAPGWNSNQQSITKFQDEVAGHLLGGDPGQRLFNAADPSGGYRPLEAVATAEWLAVALPRIFGSEPMSAAAPAIAQRTGRSEAVLHPDDAQGLGVSADDPVALSIGGTELHLPIRLDDTLARGLVGLPVGLPGLRGLALPAAVEIRA